MEDLVVIGRLVLAVVLLAAAIPKLRDRAGLTQAARELGLPHALGDLTGRLLAPAEVIVASALLVGATAWLGSLAAFGLLFAFTGLLVWNLARGRHPHCHCFGELSEAPVSWWSVVRNAVLLLIAAVAISEPQAPGPLAWASDELRDGATLRAAVAVLSGLVIAQSVALAMMLKRRPVLAQPPTADAASFPPPGLAVGADAPDFVVRSLRGGDVSLSALWTGSPLMLVFVSPTCAPCDALMPELAAWQEEFGDRLRVALVSTGSDADNREKAARYGVELYVQQGYEVATAYRYEGTPGAVLVDEGGKIASEIHSGTDSVRHLVQHAIPRYGLYRSLLPGDAAPPLRLPALDGTLVALTEFAGALTLVIFWSPTCGFCQQMVIDLQDFERRIADNSQVEILFVSDGSPVLNRRQRFRSTIVLDDDERSVMHSFGASGTPMAILVDAQGRVASELVAGADAVIELGERAVNLSSAATALAELRSPR